MKRAEEDLDQSAAELEETFKRVLETEKPTGCKDDHFLFLEQSIMCQNVLYAQVLHKSYTDVC